MLNSLLICFFFFFKQKTAYEMRISDWSSDVCSSDLNASWSLILYNAKQGLAPNPIGRYALRSTDPLQYNADGSLDIYIQRDDPGPRKAANWLPAPHQARKSVV